MDFDEMFPLAAKANCAREMRIEDIRCGLIRAFEELDLE